MLPRRQKGHAHKSCARRDKVGSTNSAVGNAAQDALHLPRSQFCVNCSNGCKATEGTVGMLEPAEGALVVAKILISNRYNTSQSVKSVGFITCQPSTPTTALQASRRKVKCAGEFFQSQARGSHQFLHHRRREALPDRLAHIPIARKSTTKGLLAS